MNTRDRQADTEQFWIDVGGTFTDCLRRRPDAPLAQCKVLSSGVLKIRVLPDSTRDFLRTDLTDLPSDFLRGYRLRLLDGAGETVAAAEVEHSTAGILHLDEAVAVDPVGLGGELSAGEEAPVLGIRLLLGRRLDEAIGPAHVRLGTTRGTNALLERKGEPVAFITTRGFGETPLIGNQTRPRLFDLDIRKPPPLHTRTAEVDERIAADGTVLAPLAPEAVRRDLAALRTAGFRAVGICLVNAYANPAHEQQIAAIARDLDFPQVSVSTEVSPLIKFLNRADTTIVDAYLSPVLRDYVNRLQTALPEADIKLMTSFGSLVDAAEFSGHESILSGPAGGVVGFSQVAIEAGFQQAIGFDMGGTSTDVSRYGGEYDYRYETEVAGVRVAAPMLAIETVAAGGGSICAFDGQRLTVGPDSAGADPGPACYGRGGPLTVTDINLFSGRIDPAQFPFPLRSDIVAERLADLADTVAAATGRRLTPRQLAAGFTEVANQCMSTAIRRISAAQGYDPAEHVLVTFGGAGAQHATAIAASLGIPRVLLPPLGGLLSAYGMGLANKRLFARRSVLAPLHDATLADIADQVDTLVPPLRQELRDFGIPADRIESPRLELDLRYAGEDTPITVTKPPDDDWAAAFAAGHRRLYGHAHDDREIEVASLRVVLVGRLPRPETPVRDAPEHPAEPAGHADLWIGEVCHRAAVFQRADLAPGATVAGPALVREAFSSIVVEPGWRGRLTGQENIVLDAVDPPDTGLPAGDVACDPIRLELFGNLFTHIAEQMGGVLQHTSLSVNVKERLDFSCAILDGQGRLVVNAPHIPVHLGAMADTVRALLREVEDLRPGDAYVTNDPGLGGSHLPDLTVMTPVFDAVGDELRFVVASRAHHAEIGGVRPGSLYPFARNLAEEGVVLRHLRLQRDAIFREDALRHALAGAPYPSRDPDTNVADLRAAVAANQLGARELGAAVERLGWPVVAAYMGHIRVAAEARTRACLRRFAPAPREFHDRLDDGSPVCVRIEPHGDGWRLDFSGSGPVNANSLNANLAVVRSAVLYCLRCLIGEDIPLNDGVFAPLELIVPSGMLNPPDAPDPRERAAVVAGNVEISQRLVDVILGAFGAAAASQGTMNNLVFGNERFGYYETLGGGAGAGPGWAGAHAVHTHMTNTRLTDIEVLEQRFPVRVRRFAMRHDSGGHGRWPGGNGLIRELEFLAPLDLSIISQRRLDAPWGLDGGGDGRPGHNRLRRADGTLEELPPLVQTAVQPGDILTVETPGGGAVGR